MPFEKKKPKSYVKIAEVIKGFDKTPFLVYHVQQETKYNYVTIKKILTAMVKFDELYFDEGTKLYKAVNR